MKHTFIIFYTVWLLVFSPGPVNAQESEEVHRNSQFPHPLNATMAIPDPVGSYNIRLNGFRQVHNNDVSYDVSGHFSYGMFEWGGLHLRSLGVKTNPLTELIGMVGLWRNERRTQGISFIGIVGIPTGKKKADKHHGLSYLAGFSGRVTVDDFINNDIILHYDFTAKHYIAESGTVVRLSPNVFGVLDTKTTLGNNVQPEVLLLPSVKFRILSGGFIGVGYNVPVTTYSTFEKQFFIQLEIGSH